MIIGMLFQTLFTDPDVAMALKCGKDKTSCITRFGMEGKVWKVVKGMFVLMFDER